jgi:energy-coupling factor transporter ATP-binding protein EcfA2
MRYEFPEPIKRKIAGRAGYRCSFPKCNRATIGPGHGFDQVLSIGKAAHIHSASVSGPRGQADLTSEQIVSVSNGIWLCSIHADLVDANRGTKFPATTLMSFRDLHERRIGREVGNIHTRFGWIREVLVEEGRPFAPGTRLELAKTTLFIGKNGVGKTALCDWITGTLDSRHLQRWQFSARNRIYSLIFDDEVTAHRIDVRFNDDEVAYSLDGQSVPYVPLAFSVIFLRHDEKHAKSPIGQLAGRLGINQQLIPKLLEEVTRNPSSAIRHAQYRKRKLFLDVVGTSEIPYQRLSGSERVRVDVEFAITLARLESLYRPTLLVIDAGLHVLDREPWADLLNRLRSQDLDFQSIVTTVEPKHDLEGWQAYIFQYANREVHLSPASI